MLDKLAILLSKKLSGEASEEELNEFEAFIQEHPDYHYFIESLEAYWHNHTHSDFSNVSDNIHFQRILEKATSSDDKIFTNSIKTPSKRLILTPFYRVAVVLIGIVLVGVVIFNYYKRHTYANKDTIVTSMGARSQMLLPDGSKVWLNAGTKLFFDKKFNHREVYLEGEAYFDVRKDKNRPFIVHTSDIDIKVLGTAFNVKSYKEEPTIEATLIHGSIQVINQQQNDIPPIILNPHEKFIYRKWANTNPHDKVNNIIPSEKVAPVFLVSKIAPVINDSTIREIAWIHNRLIFEGETFREIATKMERWFDVKIHFADETVANYRLRGVFEDETIDEALQALQQVASFKYIIKNKNIIITK